MVKLARLFMTAISDISICQCVILCQIHVDFE